MANIPEDTILHSHRRENLKSHKIVMNYIGKIYAELAPSKEYKKTVVGNKFQKLNPEGEGSTW
jgi:hypothetical protein